MADFNIVVAIDPSNAKRGARAVERQLGNVDRSAKKATKSVDSFSNSIANANKPMLALATAVGALSAAFIALNLDAVKSQIILLSDRSGVAAQEFQKVATAFQSVNFAAVDTADTLQDVNDKVGDFITTGGGEFVDIWEQILQPLGMTKEALLDLSAPDVMQAVVNGMEKLGFGVKKTTFFLESLASNSSRLLPLLRDNGRELKRISEELEQRGLLLTDEEVQSLRNFNAQLSKFSELVTNVFTKATGILANNIDIVINGLQSLVIMLAIRFAQFAIPAAISAMIKFNAILLANPIGAIATALTVVISLLIGFADQILISSNSLTTLQDVGIATFEAISTMAIATFEILFIAIDDTLKSFRANFGAIGIIVSDLFNNIDFSISGMVLGFARALDSVIGFFVGAGKAIVIVWQEIPIKLHSIFVDMFNSLSRLFTTWLNSTIQAINKLSSKIGGPLLDTLETFEFTVVKASTNIGTSMAEAISDGIERSTAVEDTLRAIKARADEIAATRIAGQAALVPATPLITGVGGIGGTEEDKQRLKDMAALLESIKGPAANYARTLEMLNTLLAQGKITTDEYNMALARLKETMPTDNTFFAGLNAGLDEVIESANDLSGQTKDLVVNAFQGMEDSLVSFVKTGKLDFKGLADSIISDLARIAIKKAIIGPLTELFKSGAGGFSGFFGAANGGVVKASTGGLISGPGGPRADLIPAQLSNGEFVVNSKSTREFQPLLEAINSGQIGTIRSTATPPPHSSNRASTGPRQDVTVQVFDQRTSRDSDPVETRQKTDTDGRRMLQIMITDTVKRGAENGLLDGTMSSRFGLRRTTTARG